MPRTSKLLTKSTTTTTTTTTKQRRSCNNRVWIFLIVAGALGGLHSPSSPTKKKYMSVLLDSYSSAQNFLNAYEYNNTITNNTINNNNQEGCWPENNSQQQVSMQKKKKVYPSDNSTIYYVPARGRRDRSGAAIIDMMKAQAYSYKMGVLFGGACGDTPHRSINEEMIKVVGLDPILKYACPPPDEDNVTANDGIRHEMITRNHFFHLPQQDLFNDEWLEYIHNEVQPKSQRWKEEGLSSIGNNDTSSDGGVKKNYTIAVHVRRGDVDPCNHYSFRYLPNSHYTGMIDHYKKQAQRQKQGGQQSAVHCIVFSEPHSLIETFDDFIQRDCQLVLGGDPTIAWKIMLDADVVIQSLSSFSNVPSLLNRRGTITFTPTLSEPLQSTWKWHLNKHSNQGWRYWIDKCDEHYGKKKK